MFGEDQYSEWYETFAWLPCWCQDVGRYVWWRPVYYRYAHLAGASDVIGIMTQYQTEKP